MNNFENKHIKCDVNNCEYHCTQADYCSLDCVCIGTHESNPTKTECVDCKSFKCKH